MPPRWPPAQDETPRGRPRQSGEQTHQCVALGRLPLINPELASGRRLLTKPQRERSARSHDLLDDGEQVKGAEGQPVNPCHRHHVAGGEGVEHAEKPAPVAVRACHLLAINLRTACSAQLLKLGVERLPAGADAGISEGRFCG
jgi:hypothetical protein